MEMKYVVGVSV